MQRENTDKPGTSVGDLISKLRELAEAELDYVAGGGETPPPPPRDLGGYGGNGGAGGNASGSDVLL